MAILFVCEGEPYRLYYLFVSEVYLLLANFHYLFVSEGVSHCDESVDDYQTHRPHACLPPHKVREALRLER